MPEAIPTELYEAADLACGIVTQVQFYNKAVASGSSKASAAITALIALEPLVAPGVGGISKVLGEVEALDEAGLMAFGAHVIEKLAITDAGVQSKVQAGLGFVAAGYSFYKSLFPSSVSAVAVSPAAQSPVPGV